MPGVVQQYVEREQELRREIEDGIAKHLGYRPDDLEQVVKEEFAFTRRYVTSESSLEETASEAASSMLWYYRPNAERDDAPEELIEVSPQALELASEINKEIAKWHVEYETIDGGSYTSIDDNRDSLDENRDTQLALASIRNHLLSGVRDIDLTAYIIHEQPPQLEIARNKDSYEKSIGNVSGFIAKAEAIGHRVKTTDFGEWDRQHRWDFVYEHEDESYGISL